MKLVVPLSDKKGPSPPPMGFIRALAPPQLLSTASLNAAGSPSALRAARSHVLEIYRKQQNTNGQDDPQAETRMLWKGWETTDKMKLHGLASRLCPGPLLAQSLVFRVGLRALPETDSWHLVFYVEFLISRSSRPCDL